MKFVEKPHVIEAVQWNGSNRAEIARLTGKPEGELFYYKQLQVMHCGELVVVRPGDYVAKLPDGAVTVFSRAHIEAYYEPQEEKTTISIPPRAGKASRVERMFGPKENWGTGSGCCENCGEAQAAEGVCGLPVSAVRALRQRAGDVRQKAAGGLPVRLRP